MRPSLPDGYGGVLWLSPPGMRSINGLPIDLQPGSYTPEPLLEHSGDRPIRCGPHVQKVVTSQSYSLYQILQQKENAIQKLEKKMYSTWSIKNEKQLGL